MVANALDKGGGGDKNIYLLLWVRKSGQNGSLKQRRLVSKVASLVKKLTKLLPKMKPGHWIFPLTRKYFYNMRLFGDLTILL